MRSCLLFIPAVLALGAAACSDSDKHQADPNTAITGQPATAADPFAAHDPAEGAAPDPALADDTPRPGMQAQVVLERLGFSPGVIDGKDGLSTRNAVSGFQEANKLPVSGKLDDATRQALSRWSNIPATRMVTIPANFAAGPFAAVPADPADQAKLPALGYESLDEKLAERFHTTAATLKELNPAGTPTAAASPAAYFRAGQQIRVPNVGGDAIEVGLIDNPEWLLTVASLGVGTNQPKVAQIVVSKSQGTLKAFAEGGKLVALFTATIGSRHDPLPLGKWKVLGVARNPPFHFNPDLFWDAAAGDKKALLPPGPNGPVGVAWIDLSKPHYGIHGTPHPETIGRAESHGCVRLTNWDLARLAQMVSSGTKVLFER